MKEGYWYLGSPYSKFPGGVVAAYRAACYATGLLIRSGVAVYSPIAHSHSVAIHSGLNPHDHQIWLPADQPLMEAARGLIVLELQGWADSIGLKHEIETFKLADKPILYMVPGIVPMELHR